MTGASIPPTPIQVLLCADGAYLQHMAVTVCSLLANNAVHRFVLTVVLDRPCPEDQNRLRGMIDGFGNAAIRFVAFDMRRLAGLPGGLHFTPVMYMRLFAAELFDAGIDRVLYLDTDLVVCADIGALWAAPIGDRAIAAAPDVFIDGQRGLPARRYANSGVMLLSLGQWRALGAGEKLIAAIAAHPARDYPDQDALNEVFADRIHILPLRWNFQARMAEARPALLGMSRREFRAVRRAPGIVHYTTGSKPWMYRKQVHYTALYYRYLAITPWKGYRPPDRTVRRRIGRQLRLMVVKQWLGWMRAGWF